MIMNALVPLACGFIIDIDYRIIFLLVAGASFISIFLVIPLPNNPHKGPKSRLDYLGSILLFFGLAGLDIGITLISYALYVVSVLLIIIGIGLLVLFCYIETKVKNPILPMKLMK